LNGLGIDVIVCAKNREKPMANVLRQITNEIPVENLIVIYGTSSDRTRETALKYTEKVYWDEDEGLSAARNIGIKKSSSEIVAMIDTDVILPKGWYQKLMRHFDDNKVAAATGTCIFGYGCTPLQKWWEHFGSLGQETWGCHNVMFRRKTILSIGNFDKRIKGAGEDYDIHKRILEAGFKWIWDKEVVVHHPMNPLEHLKHNIWWAKGVSSLNGEKPFSLSQLFIRIIFMIRGNMENVMIHPILSVYLPFIDVIWIFTDFKTRCSRQKQQRINSPGSLGDLKG
jgi:glycosyltransferase involved in cell wall biosynthesis